MNIIYPKSSFFEFYCPKNSLDFVTYCKEKGISSSDDNPINQLAEWYDDITYDKVNQIFVVEKDGKLNFIDESKIDFKTVVFDFCYLYPGFAVVRKGCQVGNLFFHEGLSEPESYRTVNIFEVKRGKYFGVESALGDTVLTYEFLFVKIYPEMILAKSDKGFFLFRKDGKRILNEFFDDIDLRYKRSQWDTRDYLYVQKNKKWGVVHLQGHWIVPPMAKSINCIQVLWVNYFFCNMEGKKGVYNDNGKLIIPFEYDAIVSGNPFIAIKNKKYGMIDHNGTILLPCVFDKITRIEFSNYFEIQQNGKISILQIPGIHHFDNPESFELQKKYQFIESCCFDFFKNKENTFSLGEYFFNNTPNFDENSRFTEWIRWYLMHSVLNDCLDDFYFTRIKNFNFSNRNNEQLLLLFEKKYRGNKFFDNENGYFFDEFTEFLKSEFSENEPITVNFFDDENEDPWYFGIDIPF